MEKIAQTNVTTRVMDVMMLMVPVTQDVTLAGLGTIVIKVMSVLLTIYIYYIQDSAFVCFYFVFFLVLIWWVGVLLFCFCFFSKTL